MANNNVNYGNKCMFGNAKEYSIVRFLNISMLLVRVVIM